MYTKGEWKVSHPIDNQTNIIAKYEYGGSLIATIKWGGVISDGEQRANAQLIASAPDLYEALRSIGDDGKVRAIFWKLRHKAIAKVEKLDKTD